jgi:hypothetical protein
MARLLDNDRKSYEAALARDNLLSDAFAERKTLEEIRRLVISNGCTKAQFDRAKETVGTVPYHVAIYLRRYAIKSSIQ